MFTVGLVPVVITSQNSVDKPRVTRHIDGGGLPCPPVLVAEYAALDATGLSELLQKREVTPREVGACALAAAESLSRPLNAIVETFPDRVEELGEAAVPGPFAGVPTMLKDLFHGEPGTRCENGSRLCAGWVAPSLGRFTARIREAGLVNLGRTTTSELGVMGTTETLAVGPTCSPWSQEHMAGGSSGGSAAAVGAGIVPVASASDGGGSIRIPASACGTVGLKPSRGRVSWAPQVGEPISGWAVHFMMTRSVRDAARLLDCLAGSETGDPFEIARPARPFAAELGAPVERLRVAVTTRPWCGAERDAEVAAATEHTAKLLGDIGHDVTEDSPRLSWEPFLRAMTDIWAVDLTHTVSGISRYLDRKPGPDTLEGPTLTAYEYGLGVSGLDLMEAAGTVNALAREFGAFFERYDVLLTPTLGRLPAALGVYDPASTASLGETFEAWGPLESFLPPFNATGLPAVSLPCEMSEGGLPIGVQLASGFGAESLLIRLASQVECASPWSGRTPPLHASLASP